MNDEKSAAPLGNLNPIAFVVISLFIIFFTYQVIGGMISLAFLGYDLNIDSKNINLIRTIVTFSQVLLIFFPVLLLNILQGGNFKETFYLRKPDIRILLLAVAGIIFIQPFLQLFMYLQNWMLFSLPVGKEFLDNVKSLFDSFESSTLSLVKSYSLTEFFIVLLVVAVTPAICEEFLFRGLILRNFNKAVSFKSAIFYTGLIFALFHFHPFNLLPLILLGVYLTFVVYYSGSIFTSVICHFINNFISAFVVFLFGYDITSSDKMNPDEINQLIITGILSLIIFISILYLIIYLFKNKQKILISEIDL